MQWIIPGTVLTAPRHNPDVAQALLSSLFLGGGIVRSQVAAITGLEPHAVQNWVKRGFLSPPENKRYSLHQLCRILTINMLKSALPMEKICALLSYVNGQLDSETDDFISDSDLYFAFLRVAALYHDMAVDADALTACIRASLDQYREPVPGAKDRVEQVIRVMVTAWASARLKQEAEAQLAQLNI